MDEREKTRVNFRPCFHENVSQLYNQKKKITQQRKSVWTGNAVVGMPGL